MSAVSKSSGDRVISRAMQILQSRLRAPDVVVNARETVRKYLVLQLAERKHEMFVALWLDAKNRLIKVDAVFAAVFFKRPSTRARL